MQIYLTIAENGVLFVHLGISPCCHWPSRRCND